MGRGGVSTTRSFRFSRRGVVLAGLLMLMGGLVLPAVPSARAGTAPGTIDASDTFNRTVSNGWGTADTGGAWSILDTASNWSVSPGAGSITVAAGGQERAYLGAVSTQDVEILTKIVLPKSTQSNNCYLYVLGRYVGGSSPTYYRIAVGQGAGGGHVILHSQRSDNSNLAPDLDTGITATDGAVIWLRVRFQGNTPTAIRARAWLNGSTEPTTWLLDTTDTNAAEQVMGAVGVRARNEDGAASHTFKVESFTATELAPLPGPSSNSIALDSFHRTVSPGWGTADIGGAWSNTSSMFAVTNGHGGVQADSTIPMSFLTHPSQQDVDMVGWITPPYGLGVGAATTDAGLAVRYGASGGTFYQVSAYAPSAANGGNLVIQLKRKPENFEINPDFNTSIPANASFWLRLQAQGTNPTTLRWHAWEDGVPEPTTWTGSGAGWAAGTGTDSTAAEQGPGGVGMEAYDSSGSDAWTYNCLGATPIVSSTAPAPTCTNPPAATAPPTSTPTSTPTNTPVPVTSATDTFNRTVSNGWGSADTGGPWTIIDTASNWSVSPGAGSIAVPANGQERAYLGSVAVQDTELLAKIVLPKSTQSNNCVAYLLGRYTGGSSPSYYRIGVGQGTGSSNVILRSQRSDGTSLSSDLNTSISAADGAVVWLRVQFQGTNPTAIRARAWLDGSTEPASWLLNTTDSNAAEQVTGAVGLRMRNEDTSASHTFKFESYQAGPISTSSSTPTPTSTSTSTPTATSTSTGSGSTPTPTSTSTNTPTPTSTSTGTSTTLASDSFNRTVTNGWGNADTGGLWTTVGTPTNWSVSTGAGSINVAAGGQELGYLSAVNTQDVDVVVKVVLPKSTQSNNDLLYLLGRYTAGYTPTYYRVGVGQGAGNSNIILRAQRNDNTSLSSDLNTGITAANGAVVWLHVQFQGTNPTAIRARAWLDGSTEPTTWLLNTTDSNAAEQVAGNIGLRARNEDTSASHTFKVESYQATGTAVAITAPAPNPTGSTLGHYLYVFPEGEMDIYNIDNNHTLFKTVKLPTSGVRGVSLSTATGMLYLSECGANCGSANSSSLVKYDLVHDTIDWIANYSFGGDSMAITPDGKTIYWPDGETSNDGTWHVIDAATGAVTGSILANTAGHNTIVSLNGSHAYLGGFQNGTNSNYLQVVDTSTNTITTKIGPLQSGVRPFTINGKETYAFTTASNFLGFQISNISTGQVMCTEQPSGFTWSTFVSTAPSHGISLSPDEKEIYLMDGPNDYVHVYDVSGLPTCPAKQVADIKLSSIAGNETNCVSFCEREGWLLHSRDGRFVYVGDTGDVISTSTRTIVANLAPLTNTRNYVEIDWQNGAPTATTTKSGLGYVTQ